MNPDDRSKRRRRGATAGLTAAVGAALAAAIIPAAPAYADTIDVVSNPDGAINSAETGWLDQMGSGLAPKDLAGLATADEKLTDTFLSQLPGGPSGSLASSFDTQLESGLGDDFSGITPGTLGGVDGEFTTFLGDYGLPGGDVGQLNGILDTLQADGLSAPLLSGLEGDLTTIFTNLLPTVGGV